MDLAKRSLFSISWNFLANLAVNGVAFLRAILLARLLPVNVFGIYTGYHAILTITVTLTEFGMLNAFVHRAPETENEDDAASMHFSLRLFLLTIWGLLAILGAVLWIDHSQRAPFLWMILATGIYQLTMPAQAVLVRRVQHAKTATIHFLFTLVHALIAVITAWLGWGIYSIIIAELVAALLAFIVYYFVRPAWRMKLGWNKDIYRYYLDFGKRAYASTFLYQLLENVDDLWTRFRLGEIPLGFYSKAYRFASYPRFILANPVTMVIGGTFAELKTDRKALSQAFNHVNALLIRTGFLLAGWMALIAPEFIRILLTDKWSPMLDAFRLMLIFTLLDPLKISIAQVLNAVGKPEKVVLARAIQLGVLMIGLVWLSPQWGIAGVALAVDFMLMVGIMILLVQVRKYVDYSIVGLFFTPSLSLIAGLALTQWSVRFFEAGINDWLSLAYKSFLFVLCYLLVLIIFERKRLLRMWQSVSQILKSSSSAEENYLASE